MRLRYLISVCLLGCVAPVSLFAQTARPDSEVQAMAELLSTYFYRALFLEHPTSDQLKYTRNLAAMARTH